MRDEVLVFNIRELNLFRDSEQSEYKVRGLVCGVAEASASVLCYGRRWVEHGCQHACENGVGKNALAVSMCDEMQVCKGEG